MNNQHLSFVTMKPTAVFLLFLLILLKTAAGQTVRGVVLDSATLAPLPYMHIGVEGKNMGVISRNDGTFSIDLSQAASQDSLTFSILGYRTQHIPYSEGQKGSLTVSLSPRTYRLREILVEDSRIRDPVKLGRHMPTKVTSGYSGTGDFGWGGEWGIRIDNNGQTYRITDINFHTRFNTQDSVLFRINLYSIQNGLPQKSLLSRGLFVKSYKRDKWITKSVTAERLMIDQDMVVTFEVIQLWHSARGDNALFFTHSKEYEQSKTYRRASSLDHWTVGDALPHYI